MTSRPPIGSIGLSLTNLSLVAVLTACGGGGSTETDYAIGGTVSGLTGTVSLANSAETLNVSTNGSFKFSSRAREGANYNVTVKTQPTGQTCLIVQGSGVVGKADITSPSVTCNDNAPNTYAVGGTVSGLSGSLVLLNGAETLTLTSSGSFSFVSRSTPGASYAVSVKTQPAGQNCSVTQGSGTVASADITTVQVTCAATVSALAGKTWQTGALIENGAGFVRTYVNRPGFELGLSDNGAATAIFMQDNGTREALMVSDWQAGATATAPSTPFTIDTAAPVNSISYRPRLAVAPGGNAVITWVSMQTCGSDSYGTVGQAGCEYIYASRRLAGATAWEAPVKVVATTEAFGSQLPMINDQGAIAVLLDGMPGMVNTISSHRAAVALRTSTEAAYRIEYLTDLQLGTLLTIGNHVLAGLDKAGRVTVVGEQANASGTRDLVAYRGTVSGGFGSTPVAEALEDRSAGANLYAMQVGLDGHVAVVWQQNTATTNNAFLISVRSPVTGAWDPRDLTADVGTSLSGYYALRVADGVDGDVSFYESCNAVRRIGGVWQPKVALPTKCGLAAGSTAVSTWAMDRNGNYIGWVGTGQWVAYDASLNTMVKAAPTGTPVAADYVLGVAKDPRYGITNQTVMALSPKGFGVSVVRSEYTVMPSALAPNGDAGALANLWAFNFK